MAGTNIGTRQWTLLPADAGAGTVYNANFKCKSFIWEEPAGANDLLVLTDQNGLEIVRARADGPNKSQGFPGGWFNGLKVATMESGRVYVYLE